MFQNWQNNSIFSSWVQLAALQITNLSLLQSKLIRFLFLKKIETECCRHHYNLFFFHHHYYYCGCYYYYYYIWMFLLSFVKWSQYVQHCRRCSRQYLPLSAYNFSLWSGNLKCMAGIHIKVNSAPLEHSGLPEHYKLQDRGRKYLHVDIRFPLVS